MAKKYDKEKLIAEWKTGDYTQRDLASKYKLSPGMIAKIVKGISKESEQLVSNLIESNHELTLKSEQERISINEVVSRELQRKAKAQIIAEALDDGLNIATNASVKILQGDDVTMSDVIQFGKFQNDARVGLDLQPKFSQTTINNSNAQQNNGLKEPIEFTRASRESA